jgi:hypothetical protein
MLAVPPPRCPTVATILRGHSSRFREQGRPQQIGLEQYLADLNALAGDEAWRI